jgi:butyrate kinase
MKKVLVINLGAGSTKLAIYYDTDQVYTQGIRHTPEELAQFETNLHQLPWRLDLIRRTLDEAGMNLGELDAVVGRGGPFKPLESGTYLVNEQMLEDVQAGRVQAEHISNIGCLLAHEIADPLGIPSFIVDPVSVDEFPPVARLSGMPEIPRRSLGHALNIKMVARKAAAELGKSYSDCRFVVVHLGSGISVSAHQDGRMVDINNANDEGPFSPQRCGGVPATQLTALCYNGRYSEKEMMDKLIRRGGLTAYLGSDSLEEAERRVAECDEEATLVLDAMAYQVAKGIGCMAAAVGGYLDAVVISGGMAHSETFIQSIRQRVKFLGPVLIYPGEGEMEALARGALRVLEGEEEVKVYR